MATSNVFDERTDLLHRLKWRASLSEPFESVLLVTYPVVIYKVTTLQNIPS